MSAPDLVALQVVLDEAVEELKLFDEISFDGNKGVGTVLPARRKQRQ